VLDAVRASSLELATQPVMPAPVRAAYLADAKALKQAQGLVAELASELGISLPLSRGVNRKK